ncbi:hypothetical protein JCM19992_24230 [Thermostilla marina]
MNIDERRAEIELAERLKTEADYLRPAFSEDRQEQIMAAVYREVSRRSRQRWSFESMPVWVGVLTGMTLGILLMVGILSLLQRDGDSSRPVAQENAPNETPTLPMPVDTELVVTGATDRDVVDDPIEPIEAFARTPQRAAEEVSSAVEQRLKSRSWGTLDDDAETAKRFVRSKLSLGLIAAGGN